MITVNSNTIDEISEVNYGSVIEFEDGRNLKIYSIEEVNELILLLEGIKLKNNL